MGFDHVKIKMVSVVKKEHEDIAALICYGNHKCGSILSLGSSLVQHVSLFTKNVSWGVDRPVNFHWTHRGGKSTMDLTSETLSTMSPFNWPIFGFHWPMSPWVGPRVSLARRGHHMHVQWLSWVTASPCGGQMLSVQGQWYPALIGHVQIKNAVPINPCSSWQMHANSN